MLERPPIQPVEIDEIVNTVAPPFPDATTLEIIKEGRTAGYVFCCAGTTGGVTQEQRWLLFEGAALAPPVTMRKPADPSYQRCATLEDWQALINGMTWPAGAWYVKVNAACYGDLRDPEDRAPEYPPLYPATKGPEGIMPPYQMVDRDGVGVFQGDLQSTRGGDVYGTKLELIGNGLFRNREYWVMHAPAATPMSLQGGGKAERTFQQFLNATFVAGSSTLTISSCAYLDRKPRNP